MRFRHQPVIICLFFTFAYPAGANADLLALQMEPALSVANTLPTYVDADSLTGNTRNQIEATGNVKLRNGDQSISADRLTYSQETQDLEAQGSVLLEQKGSSMRGPLLKLNLETGTGRMEQPSFYIEESNGRGDAEMLHIQDKQHMVLERTSYTTCPADNHDWVLKIRNLEIDRDRQVGTAHHTWIEFMGAPILYTPWMDFPLNNQRKSGFLSPVFGGTVAGGSEFTLPYYWNIAPNFDATIAPRIMLKRGQMINTEFRYLQENYVGKAHLDVLPNDLLTHHSRERVALDHKQALATGLSGHITFARVSDDAYFRDLGNAVNVTSQANLLQETGLDFNLHQWRAALRVQRFQTLQDPGAPISAPYSRRPQLTVNTQQIYSNANFALSGEFVDFSHPTALNGQRMVINPSVSYPLSSSQAYYLTPKIGVHSTQYVMGANNSSGLQDARRTLPMLSVDTGVAFEREENLFGTDYVQTLEPRAFYVYVPYRDQTALPNFDSAKADFSFTQMFTENRFFGSDRIGDANQITLAGTSRWLDKHTGAERLAVTLGERFSFTAPRVNLLTPANSSNKSDILLAATGRVTKSLSLDSEFQLDPNDSHTQRYALAGHYNPESGKVLNLGYRFTRNTLRQVDISTQWPVFNRWHGVGRWNYSLQDDRILEAIAGLEYNQSCWTLRLVAQRFATATQQTNTGFFMQLELNDLVRMGADPLGLLKQSVPGYSKLNEKPEIQH